MSASDWVSLARAVVQYVDSCRAEHLDEDDKGRVVMPSFGALSPADTHAQAAKLLRAACMANPRIRDAIGAAANYASGSDGALVRELLAMLEG